MRLYVSGVSQGVKSALVRTTDSNADGRTDMADYNCICYSDLNYSGSVTGADGTLVLDHGGDWHRNTLFGTPVRRTNLSYAEGQAGSIGESAVFWSPNGHWLSYTVHGPLGTHCHVFIVGSDPGIGDTPRQFTNADSSDYDPSWSALNNEIAFGRADYRIVRKGILGFSSDTNDYLVAASGDPQHDGDLTPAISPNGRWVAFGRKDQVTFDYHIWKVPITGGAATQLTFTAGVPDQYPSWSPDGEWIYFDREIGYPNPHLIYKVKANQSLTSDTLTTLVYSAGAGKDAATPAVSPDNLIVSFGSGTHDDHTVDVRAYTLDPSLATPKPVLNYPDTAFAIHGPDPVLSPVIGFDGTRLALRSRQIWAVRRNMNLPPQFTNIGSHALTDSTPVVSDAPYIGDSLNFAVLASDPEGDPLTYSGFFLQAGMTFDAGTRTFAWRVPGPASMTYYVKFMVTTPSGGTDVVLDKFAVQACCGPHGPASDGAIALERVDGPNPTAGECAVWSGLQPGVTARLSIFDVAGRRVALVQAPAGRRLVWDGNGASGRRAPAGIYLYRVEVGTNRREGRLVVMR